MAAEAPASRCVNGKLSDASVNGIGPVSISQSWDWMGTEADLPRPGEYAAANTNVPCQPITTLFARFA
jgi:hypothetical protein